MRVIVDLVVNHTSRKHPWFRSAERSKDSPFRDFYVWRSDPPPDTKKEVVFPDQEDSIWTLSEPTGEWYLHKFYKEQPDLNVTEPAGAGRGRQDHGLLAPARSRRLPRGRRAVLPRDGRHRRRRDLPEPHDYLRALRALVGRRSGSGVLLGEVNLPYEQQLQFFGGDERRRADHAVRLHRHAGAVPGARPRRRRTAGEGAGQAGRRCIRTRSGPRSCATTTSSPSTSSSDEERAEVFAAFGPEETMQVYGRGLRRRLPPMLDGDPRRIRMVYSLLFSLPGTPVLFYGEEIGMGEDLDAEGRLAVRTPMQWTSGRNGGFSPRPAAQAARTGGERRLRAGVRQRGRPAQRPGLAAVVHEAADPPVPGVAGARAGASFEVLRAAVPGGAGAPRAPGTTARWSRCTTSAPSPASCRSRWRAATPRTGWSTCCSRGETGDLGQGHGRDRARGLRLPLAAGGRRGQPPAGLRERVSVPGTVGGRS